MLHEIRAYMSFNLTHSELQIALVFLSEIMPHIDNELMPGRFPTTAEASRQYINCVYKHRCERLHKHINKQSMVLIERCAPFDNMVSAMQDGAVLSNWIPIFQHHHQGDRLFVGNTIFYCRDRLTEVVDVEAASIIKSMYKLVDQSRANTVENGFDEAVETVQAEQQVRHGLVNY